MNPEVKRKLLAGGIRQLKEFGYPDVNESNILTDYIYSAFFRSMLAETRDDPACPPVALPIIAELIAVCDATKAAGIPEPKKKAADRPARKRTTP